MQLSEVNFDGLVGPTHAYAGLSPGNLAAMQHAGQIGNPRAAALEGLDKMRFVASLGVGQAVLPPHPRPAVAVLRQLGFSGTDAAVLESAARIAPELLPLVSSASAMWTANAATVIPSADASDGRLHLVVANLSAMFHRSLEAPATAGALRAVFAAGERFAVHEGLPPHFADEGAANHSRLVDRHGPLHLFGWGRRAFGATAGPRRHPARQTLEASQAVARLGEIRPGRARFLQQHPDGIDAGAFHSDVLAVGNEGFLMLHELAFAEPLELDGVSVCLAQDAELPVADAVQAYPFNSQIVTLPSGKMAIIAPLESRETPAARRFLERVVAEDNPVEAVHFIDVNASMKNGGGPACLRLRVQLTAEERQALGGRVLLDDALHAELLAWIQKHYRDRISAADLGDPALLDETRAALDELTRILRLGSIYDFQS
jgi:succinylarginine dihydrolase